MKSRIKAVLSIIVFALGVVIFVTGFYARDLEENAKKKVEEYQRLKILSQGAKELQKLWKLGDYEGRWKSGRLKCKNLPITKNSDGEFLRCNPLFLECVFSHRFPHLLVKEGEKNHHVLVRDEKGKFTKTVARATDNREGVPTYGVEVELFLNPDQQPSLKVFLESRCHSQYLPEGVYAFGPMKRGKSDKTWDNFGRKIFVDKYQVTNQEVLEWKRLTGKKDIKVEHDVDQLALPATQLTLQQMRDYCTFRGKTLLSTHVFDAATFYTESPVQQAKESIFRGPYPWDKRKKKNFIYRAIKSGKYKATKKSCTKLYSKECLKKFKQVGYQTGSDSWMGVSQVLGGQLEAFESYFDDQNLKVSSSYFSIKSPWHQLGVRAKWDGKGHSYKSVDWRLKGRERMPVELPEKLDIAFRCMEVL